MIEELQKAKEKKRLTLKQISELSGVPLRTVEDIFRGATQTPHISTLNAIRDALGIVATGVVLTDIEERLLVAFNQLPEVSQNAVIDMIEGLVGQTKTKRSVI